jgi:small subunit ribosomal protein S3
MEAGALGCEIVISGKLRTERARFEKFRAGYFPRCGEPALHWMRKTEAHVQLKPGMFGVKVKIMPPDAQFPDKINILTEAPPTAVIEKKPEAEPLPEEKPAEKVEAKPEEKPAETAPAQEAKKVEAPPEPAKATPEKAAEPAQPAEEKVEEAPK